MAGGWLIRKLLKAMLGGVANSLTGGDPLAADRASVVDDEERERDPVFPLVRVRGLVPRDRFGDVIAQVDAALERGFRETQKEVLRARAVRLKLGENFVLLCNVFHGGVPSALQIAVGRAGSGVNAVLVEGRGPALKVVERVFGEQEVLVVEARDGVFHPIEEGGWVARIPASQGSFLGQEVEVVVEDGWPGLPESGEPSDSPLLQGLLNALPDVLAIAERGFQRFVSDVDVLSDVSGPRLVFPSAAESENQWFLQIARSNWPGFRWHIEFEGDRALDITAGG